MAAAIPSERTALPRSLNGASARPEISNFPLFGDRLDLDTQYQRNEVAGVINPKAGRR
jgi:hypothetical protein